ncbi:hypothetical protein [Flagellimonas sp. S3867]|uniref:hypothetical protein n=1 Tax=Flagellimonas sp. S3867 TaxID=2768063 RepID=UPI0016859B99|nr:hypothetical protein [Flagellimonas sp. S3867]
MKEFSLSRIGQFIRRDITIHKSTFVTGLLVGIVLIFLFCIFNMMWDKQLSTDEFFGIFGLIYIPMGVLFTFSIFKEFNDAKTNQLYLSIPLSIPERLASKWFTSTIIYTLVYSILAIITGILALLFGIVIFDADFNVPSLFSIEYWNVLKVYFLVQPLFLVGAISFRKNRIGKTLLFLGILVLGFTFFNFFLFGIFNHNHGLFSGETLVSEAFDKTTADFSGLGRWFYGLLLGPLMLIVAYFKMKEKEV